MKIRSSLSLFAIAAAAVLPHSTAALAAEPAAQHETVVPAFAYALPNVPGKTISAFVVTYPPGAKSLPHRHGSAFVAAYVLSGAIRSQVEGSKVQVFHAGESWSEAPGAHHVISENASATEPAALLAIFTADTGDKHLVEHDRK